MSKIEELEALLDDFPKPESAKIYVREKDLRKLLAVVRAAQNYEQYLPKSDLFGATRYADQVVKSVQLKQTLAALEGG